MKIVSLCIALAILWYLHLAKLPDELGYIVPPVAIASAGDSSLVNSKEIPVSVSSIFDDETKNSIVHAQRMLFSEYGNAAPFLGRSNEEIGKFLTQLVFSHCKQQVPYTGQTNINDLFDVCNTACGGFSYVLRGLLAAHGINSRYVNLYNIPNQGNHTMVEAEIEPGKWALFDPTFGTFFSKNGKLDGTPYSLSGLRFGLSSETISGHAFTAIKSSDRKQDLESIYSKENYQFKYMSLSNYLVAEKGAPVGLNITVPLTLNMNLSSGFSVAGIIDFKSELDGQERFLKWTNETLNNKDVMDDVSYLFHKVGNYAPYFKTGNYINLSDLKAGLVYELTLSGFTRHQTAIQVIDIGRSLRLENIAPENINVGKYTIKRLFRAKASTGQIYITLNGDNNAKTSLFGISVSEN